MVGEDEAGSSSAAPGPSRPSAVPVASGKRGENNEGIVYTVYSY